jgi:hypothetical protein
MLTGFRNAAVLAVLAVLLAVPRLAEACSCLAVSPCRQYADADAVLAGEVVGVTETAGRGPGKKVVRLRVVRANKGPAQAGEIVAVEMPGGSSASCSLDATAGDRLVIYASVAQGRISTHLCQGSHALQAGAAWPELPPRACDVTGKLVRRPEFGAAPVPVADVDVWITTPAGRVAGRTDAAGAFRLSGVPMGRWTVEADVGSGERAQRSVVLASADDCAAVYLSVQAQPTRN